MLVRNGRWSLGEEDARRIEEILSGFLAQTGARSALVIDHTGQLVTATGEPIAERDGIASLTAADFSANDQLAGLLGADAEAGPIVHQGERGSMLLADIARRVILVALFDGRTTQGLVKLRARGAVRQLEEVFLGLRAQERGGAVPRMESEFVGEAAAEIDRLFGV